MPSPTCRNTLRGAIPWTTWGETSPPIWPKRGARRGDADAWLDFLADLASLEWNIAEVFDGPGVENQALLDVDRLQAVPAERWAEARLVAVPCLRLVRLPGLSGRRLLPGGCTRRGRKSAPEPAETFLAITRRDFVVRHYRLTPPQHAILGALVSGESVATAVMHGAEWVREEDFTAFAGDLQETFRRWAAEGFFMDVRID